MTESEKDKVGTTGDGLGRESAGGGAGGGPGLGEGGATTSEGAGPVECRPESGGRKKLSCRW